MIREDHLIQALERIDADRARRAGLEPELLGHFAQHGGFGVLAALEKPRYEAVPRRRPADAVHEHHAARALDDGRDDWHGIAPVHEPALRAGEPRLAAALTVASSGRQWGQ